MQDSIYQPAYQKQCTTCRLWLPFSEFTKCNQAKDGLYGSCRSCRSEYRTANATPGMHRKYKLWHYYGMTLQQYERMLEEQGGVCAICKKPEITPGRFGTIKPLSVDHDHGTGDVRALLCHHCNVALGYMDEDPELIQRLKEYAEWCRTREPNIKIVQLPLLGDDVDKSNDCL